MKPLSEPEHPSNYPAAPNPYGLQAPPYGSPVPYGTPYAPPSAGYPQAPSSAPPAIVPPQPEESNSQKPRVIPLSLIATPTQSPNSGPATAPIAVEVAPRVILPAETP